MPFTPQNQAVSSSQETLINLIPIGKKRPKDTPNGKIKPIEIKIFVNICSVIKIVKISFDKYQVIKIRILTNIG